VTNRRPGIYGFFGDFRFLSNFWLAEVEYEGAMYPSTEAAYQAAKTLDLNARKQFQMGSGIAGRQAKHLGYKLELRPDWENIKDQVMYDVCKDKFTRHQELREALLLTDDLYLEETNHWEDTYWGVCSGEGRNQLGKTLMAIRQEIAQEKHDGAD